MSEPLPTFFKSAVDAAIQTLQLGLNPKQTADLVAKISNPSHFHEDEDRQEATRIVQDIILKKWNANQSYTTPFIEANPKIAEGYSDAHQFSKDQSENGKKAYLEAAVALGTVLVTALNTVRTHHIEIAAGISLFEDKKDTPKTPANDIDALQAETSRLLKLYAEKLGQTQQVTK